MHIFTNYCVPFEWIRSKIGNQQSSQTFQIVLAFPVLSTTMGHKLLFLSAADHDRWHGAVSSPTLAEGPFWIYY
jgi:hypothetical protein